MYQSSALYYVLCLAAFQSSVVVKINFIQYILKQKWKQSLTFYV